MDVGVWSASRFRLKIPEIAGTAAADLAFLLWIQIAASRFLKSRGLRRTLWISRFSKEVVW